MLLSCYILLYCKTNRQIEKCLLHVFLPPPCASGGNSVFPTFCSRLTSHSSLNNEGDHESCVKCVPRFCAVRVSLSPLCLPPSLSVSLCFSRLKMAFLHFAQYPPSRFRCKDEENPAGFDVSTQSGGIDAAAAGAEAAKAVAKAAAVAAAAAGSE